MAFLEPEQLFAVAISAQRDIGMPIDDSSPDYMINVALSPSFIDVMYIDKFCEEIFNSNDYSLENQCSVAIDVIEDTITHRWVKHLKPLATNCIESFMDYSEKKFQSSTCIIKTLANILSVMVAFENMYAYEPVSNHDQLAHQKEIFITKLESNSTVEQLIETIEPEDLRGDAIAVATIRYYEKMCDKFRKGDIGKLFVKSKQSLKNKQKSDSISTANKPIKQSNAQKTKSNKPTTHSFIKSMAELAGGGILLLIGSSASSGFFIAAGTLGIAKGLYTLFISSSTAIWRKIPRQKISARDDGNGNMTKAIQAKKNIKMYFNLRTVVLALSCIALTIFAIVYYMNLNMSDVSLRVAKMQSGIEDFNPNYIPPDFSLTNIVSENGKITLNFKNHTTGSDFSLIAEQSTWDSNTLLTNFVKHNYSSDYATIHKQGLTIYIDGSNASWISNKVVYKIISNSGSLTKDQICSIATSI